MAYRGGETWGEERRRGLATFSVSGRSREELRSRYLSTVPLPFKGVPSVRASTIIP